MPLTTTWVTSSIGRSTSTCRPRKPRAACALAVASATVMGRGAAGNARYSRAVWSVIAPKPAVMPSPVRTPSPRNHWMPGQWGGLMFQR